MKNVLAVLLIGVPFAAFAQTANVQINRDNRTISVNSDHTITVEPEIAIVTLGFRNSSPRKDTAFRENVRVAGEILKALEGAQIGTDQISTASLKLARQEQSEERPVKPELLQFEALQSWTVRISAKGAQAAVDLAVKAGANEVSGPDWTVADPVELESRAYGAALAKARKIAEQMALGLGAQLGDLIYATNSAGVRPDSTYYMSTPVPPKIASPSTPLRILPKKVERRVEVVAVFNLK
jgi:uncharacterized protein YggE